MDRGGPSSGQGDAAGRHPSKNLRPVRQRKLVDGICCEWGVSIRRACRAFEVDTSTYHYKSRRSDQASLEIRIREICQTRIRYGYRRVHVLLRREGWQLGQIRSSRRWRRPGWRATRGRRRPAHDGGRPERPARSGVGKSTAMNVNALWQSVEGTWKTVRRVADSAG